MEKIKIIIDSTSYLSDEYIKENDLEVASLHVVVDGKSYEEVDVDNEFVFDCFEQGKKVSTAAVAPAVFADLFEKYKDHTILVFPLSSGLSGTFQSAFIAKEMVDADVHIFDSKVAAYGVENIVMQVVDAVKEGKSKEEVIDLATTLSSNGHVLFTLTTLDHVVRGGRISKVSATIANIVGIKPVVEMVDGRLEVTRKSRTNKRIVDKFIVGELIANSKKFSKIFLRIISLKKDEIAKEIEEKLKHIPNIIVTHSKYIGPVFSYHLGDEGYGITWTAM